MPAKVYREALAALIFALLAVANEPNSLVKLNDYQCVLDSLLRMMSVSVPVATQETHDIIYTTLRGMPYDRPDPTAWDTITNMCLDMYKLVRPS